jgi:ribonuclease-3 family protein
MLVRRGICKSGDLNSAAQEYVTAEAQARMLSRIEPLLLEDELAVYKRAANSGHLNKPKRASAKDYRAATGFEAVIGMLHYIGDEERLSMLLERAHSPEAGDGLTENKENGKREEQI